MYSKTVYADNEPLLAKQEALLGFHETLLASNATANACNATIDENKEAEKPCKEGALAPDIVRASKEGRWCA